MNWTFALCCHWLAIFALGFELSSKQLSKNRLRNTWLLAVQSKQSNLESKDYLIAPSILSANLAKLGEEVDNVIAAGADLIHFDVMDNHYVPCLTFGPILCKSLRDHGVLKDIDVHLMVSPLDNLIKQFALSGATYITFHPELSSNVEYSLNLIHSLGCKCGLVLNPGCSLNTWKHLLHKIDVLMLMSVHPGFSGQEFLPETYLAIQEARRIIDFSGLRDKVRLQVDGGINIGNIRQVAESGADAFVAGSAIFKPPRTMQSYLETIQIMRRELSKDIYI